MKTNEEPKVLYLQPDSSHSAGKRYLKLNKVSDNDIEYIRKDAFIEKACEWLECNNTLHDGEVSDYIEEFKKAMML